VWPILYVMGECDGAENMSEPMSSGDIEDVLSSIRRLVSEDLRPVAKPAEGARPVATEPAGKLLLTPALRVVAAQDTGRDTGAEPATAFVVDRSGLKAISPDVSGKVVQDDDEEDAFVESAAPEFDGISQTPIGAQPAAAMPDSLIPDAAQPETTVADEDWLPESQDDDIHPGWAQTKTAESDDIGAKAAAASKLTRVVSEIGAGVSEAEDDWEPETGDAPVSSLSWQAPEWVEEAELADDDRFGEALENGFDKSAADLAEDAAVAEIMERAAASKAQAKAEQVQAEPVKEAAKPEAEKDDIFADDEGVFDETVLRDLVRDLIREELSGTLGERITRNVRKLVRAEINRALTARDFD